MVRIKNKAVGIPEVFIQDETSRQMIRRLLRELPTADDSRIAGIVGCATKDVSQIRRELLDSGELQRHEVDNAT